MAIRIGIYGYGNLGRGVECAIKHSPDMKLVGVFSRRDPQSVKILTENVKVFKADDIAKMKEDIDVVIMCGGSAKDLPVQSPLLAKDFNIIDSFDTHANIPTHFENVNQASIEGQKTSMISVGWDPGLFSLNRLLADAIISNGKTHTFWGKGISQGHSDALRRIDGVVDAKQYTIPIEKALEVARSGENVELTAREKHERECFVVVKDGADKAKIETQIKTMPNYFSDYNTTVHFVSQEYLNQNCVGYPHGGFVIRSGKTGWNDENTQTIEYSLKLDSNPEFTSSVILAYARAVYRLNKEGCFGCKTVFDIAPKYLTNLTDSEIRSHLL
ncbi:MAG: diaminopimelate dehydrogenase [Clostridia bacterium]